MESVTTNSSSNHNVLPKKGVKVSLNVDRMAQASQNKISIPPLYKLNYEEYKKKNKFLNFGNEIKDVNSKSFIDIVFLVEVSDAMTKFRGIVELLIKDIVNDGENFFKFESFQDKQIDKFLTAGLVKYDLKNSKMYASKNMVSYLEIDAGLYADVNKDNLSANSNIVENIFKTVNSAFTYRDHSSKFLIHFLQDPSLKLDINDDHLAEFRGLEFDYTVVDFNPKGSNSEYLTKLQDYIKVDITKFK